MKRESSIIGPDSYRSHNDPVAYVQRPPEDDAYATADDGEEQIIFEDVLSDFNSDEE